MFVTLTFNQNQTKAKTQKYIYSQTALQPKAAWEGGNGPPPFKKTLFFLWEIFFTEKKKFSPFYGCSNVYQTSFYWQLQIFLNTKIRKTSARFARSSKKRRTSKSLKIASPQKFCWAAPVTNNQDDCHNLH
eukprot:TRINITY_DN28352_c0_g1_i1.p1 TRINITY_DN28352_c0_g1~~TRINITY_DN28352_c0_g1_i1.p1  ORF type:complete len:131 (-),score=17.86 TRINITY_DN28352_c0_g1_i1:26-418(-)